ncbi:MAG: hypothetical protein Q8P68_06260 [Candidatus Peregrinibacteria bacterium]|nr:hypothetical protein [Candidatus Peregrinibacteria bacterium]MDZ4245144.1 hypothetical protein [Candidatus Gracilibacteria bacterium]
MYYNPPVKIVSFRIDKELYKTLTDVTIAKRMCYSTYIRRALLKQLRIDMMTETENRMWLSEEIAYTNGEFDLYNHYPPFLVNKETDEFGRPIEIEDKYNFTPPNNNNY